MSCANSERFRVDFSLKLCIASHGLGEENLGWYGCIVHFLRVQGYIPECTGTDKPMLNFTHSVRTHCLSMIRNEKQ